jgi:hypothetical protein
MKSVAVALIVGAGLARLATAQTPCEATFESGGSFLKGRIYSVYADDADVPVDLAVQRLAQQVPGQGFEIVAVDASRGVVKTIGTRLRTTSFDFQVVPNGAGSRVKMTTTFPLGVFAMPIGNAVANLRTTMCNLVALAATGSPADTAQSAAAAPPPPPAAEPAPAEPAAAVEPPPFVPQEPPLTNDEIVRLTRAGLDPDLIVAKIKQASTESFDVSTDALIKLRQHKVSKAVIAAMLQRTGSRSAAPPK